MIEPAPRSADGTLHCTFLDRRSSIVLGDARITCIWPDGRLTRYDADRFGAFRAMLPQGAYDLVISARGYLSLVVRGIGVLDGFDHRLTRALAPGQGGLEEPPPAAAVGGFVRDRLGRGIAGLTVRISGDSRAATHAAATARDGAYVINGVEPQRYDLEVMAQDRRLLRAGLEVVAPKRLFRTDLRLVTH